MPATKDWADARAEYFIHEMQAGKPLVAERLADQFRLERALGERDGIAESLNALRAARIEPMEVSASKPMDVFVGEHE